MWNWLVKVGRVVKWVNKSGKSREFHAGKGVRNNTEFIHTKCRVF